MLSLRAFASRINYGHTPAAWDDAIVHLGMTYATLVDGRVSAADIADTNVMRNAMEISYCVGRRY